MGAAEVLMASSVEPEVGKNRGVGLNDVVRRRVVVDGRVQGVWFRESCRQEAERLGVAGWVTNRGDGRVEAVFEGAPPSVELLVAWCHRGPRRADVVDVEVHTEEPEGLRSFRVS
jgi:acylphosphatase